MISFIGEWGFDGEGGRALSPGGECCNPSQQLPLAFRAFRLQFPGRIDFHIVPGILHMLLVEAKENDQTVKLDR